MFARSQLQITVTTSFVFACYTFYFCNKKNYSWRKNY